MIGGQWLVGCEWERRLGDDTEDMRGGGGDWKAEKDKNESTGESQQK